MGHYDSTWLCGEDEHDFSDERLTKGDINVVLHQGQPSLKVDYKTKMRCSNKREKNRVNSDETFMKQCEAERTNLGRSGEYYVPVSRLRD